MEAGQAPAQTLALIDGEGPGFMETSEIAGTSVEPEVRYLDETTLDFEGADVLGDAPKSKSVPWWVWALIALAAANLLKGGK